jgi:hypothetical protein
MNQFTRECFTLTVMSRMIAKENINVKLFDRQSDHPTKHSHNHISGKYTVEGVYENALSTIRNLY